MNDRQAAAELATRFASLTGRRPDGVFAAPGRVNLIGEHTDYNDGFVLPVAISQQAMVAMRPRDDGTIRIWSDELGYAELAVSALNPGGVEGWSAYVAGALWAVGAVAGDVRGADVLLQSNVPVGAGLSSSAAVECATVLAAASLSGLKLAPFELAMLAHRAEYEFVGMPCGIMDQTVSMCARQGHALFLDCRTKQTQHVPLDLEAADLDLAVIDTRAPHHLNDGAYAERRAACEAAARQLGVPALRDASLDDLERQRASLEPTAFRRAKHVATENARVLEAVELLRLQNPAGLAPLFNASHASLRDDFEVTVPELDVAQAAALAAGALGARMVGGGFGGCILVLTQAGTSGVVLDAVANEFRANGFAAPQPYEVRSGAGARRVG